MSVTLKDTTVNSIQKYHDWTLKEVNKGSQDIDDGEFGYNLGALHAFADVLEMVRLDDVDKGKKSSAPYLFIAAGVIVGSAVVYQKRNEIVDLYLDAKFYVRERTEWLWTRFGANGTNEQS